MYIIGSVIHIYPINQYYNEKYVRPNPTHLTSLEFWSTHRIMHQTALWQQAYPTIPSCLQNHIQMFKMKDESSLISTMLHLHSSRRTITFDSSYIETQQYFEESYLKMKTSKIPLLLFHIYFLKLWYPSYPLFFMVVHVTYILLYYIDPNTNIVPLKRCGHQDRTNI